MSKHELTQLLIKGDKPYKCQDVSWFKRYNDVIEVHNQGAQPQRKLQPLDCTYKPYLLISYFLNNYLLNIAMVLIFTFLPLINLTLLIFLISYTMFLKHQTKKHKQNLQKVSDPFQNFYYYPQMCQQLEKHFTTLNLTVEEIENFKFNESSQKLRESLVTGSTDRCQGEKKKKEFVKVPIYDQYFYDSFFLVRKQYFKAISWSLLGIVLIALSVLFYCAIYDDLTQ